jgi:hypothetical protein
MENAGARQKRQNLIYGDTGSLIYRLTTGEQMRL